MLEQERHHLQESHGEVSTPHKRGIAPKLLLEQVANTVPFIFQEPETSDPDLYYLDYLRRTAKYLESHDESTIFNDHLAYFTLCVSAHHATVASFVPTDVDVHIRLKLWGSSPSREVTLAMAQVVEDSLDWNYKISTTRFVASPKSGLLLTGHHGEWFSTAAAAYAAVRHIDTERAALMRDLIVEEVAREAQIFLDLREAGDGIGMLKAATLIAHNLGDLDRVIEAWNLADDDDLKSRVYKAGHEDPKRFQGSLFQAGALNKQYMANENHRHYALRKPRCLRRSRDLFLPTGPFFDAWGASLAKSPHVTEEEVAEVTEALIDGWQRLAGPVGYARAIRGIEENIKGGVPALNAYLPAKLARTIKAGPLRNLVSVPQGRFEAQWEQFALRFVRGK